MIVDMACGARHSFLLTKSGQIWATGNVQEDKSTRLQQLNKALGAEPMPNEEQKDGFMSDDQDAPTKRQQKKNKKKQHRNQEEEKFEEKPQRGGKKDKKGREVKNQRE